MTPRRPASLGCSRSGRPSAAPLGATERWIIKTRFRHSSDVAYWGNLDPGTGLTPYRTNAITFESEDAARYEGYTLKERDRIGEFEVERIPSKPERRSYSYGTGGRA